jgi:D-alanine-D-alanine ligase-like ATP-grasp enzyme
MRVLLVGNNSEQNEILKIMAGLEETGYEPRVHIFNRYLSADDNANALVRKVADEKIDIVFPRVNFYAGDSGEQHIAKKSYLTQHLSSLNIPVIGWMNSKSQTVRNKAKCEALIFDSGAESANPFLLIDPENTKANSYGHILDSRGFSKSEIKNPFSKYPILFIKPNSLGRSAGIADSNVVTNLEELTQRALELRNEFEGVELLINPFYSGREFTIGIIGNNTKINLPVQICQSEGYSKHRILLQGVKRGGIPSGKVYAQIIKDFSIAEKLRQRGKEVFGILDIQDYTRIDFKEDEKGEVHAIDVNGVPGLKLMESYLAMAAENAFKGQENGYSIYGRLVSSVVFTGAQRYNLKTENYPSLFDLKNKLFEK